MQIDHNPHEKRPTNTIWWVAWGVVALLWVGQIAINGFSSVVWDQIALGGLTIGIFVLWAMEMKGDNSVPAWMVPKPRKRYLPDPTPGEPMTGRNGKALLLVIPAFIALTVALIWLT